MAEETSDFPVWEGTQWNTPHNIYEGTDSEDDAYITSGRTVKVVTDGVATAKGGAKEFRSHVPTETETDKSESEEDTESHLQNMPEAKDLPQSYKHLKSAELAPVGERFTPFQLVKKYPYSYIGRTNQQAVAEGFFDQGRLYDYIWDFFYLYRLKPHNNLQPILLVPTKQFESFLGLINFRLQTKLTLPRGKDVFSIIFPTDGTPMPRYLGNSSSESTASSLRDNVPPSYYTPEKKKQSLVNPTNSSLKAFQAIIELIDGSSKAKSAASRAKSKKEREAARVKYGKEIKRVQRYLGLRPSRSFDQQNNQAFPGGQASWDSSEYVPPPPIFKAEEAAPFMTDRDVIFICVDIEAYEKDQNVLTEIGFATLDTRDLKGIAPGESGKNWMKLIRARHFRIIENAHFKNGKFVDDCADKFNFGKSEMIKLQNAHFKVSSCFSPPYLGPGTLYDAQTSSPDRNIVLVGHDLKSDIDYLKKINFDTYKIQGLLEHIDTTSMWKRMVREDNPRKLAVLLNQLNLSGWNLHNAGNDAVYTLHAMIGIAVKHVGDHSGLEKLRELKIATTSATVTDSVAEAGKIAKEREEGWTSDDGDDGGSPIRPVPAAAKKSSTYASNSSSPGLRYASATSGTPSWNPRSGNKPSSPNNRSSWELNPESSWDSTNKSSPKSKPKTSRVTTKSSWESQPTSSWDFQRSSEGNNGNNSGWYGA